MFAELSTPSVLVDADRLEKNVTAMQAVCDAHGVQLRPHIKTHKCVEIARLQLDSGAAGLTCAKIGEAEAMLPAMDKRSRREIFIAHAIADPGLLPRLRALRLGLDELVLAVSSEAHAPVLAEIACGLAAGCGGKVPVMMAVDTGLHREGARGIEGVRRLAQMILGYPQLSLKGIYTHEGHFYAGKADLDEWFGYLVECHKAVEEVAGHPVLLWPGCSVTASRVATFPGVDAVRPGAYMFGDLALTVTTNAMAPEDVAVSVVATVVDRPESGLALLDSGSKTLSSDKTALGVHARCEYGDVTRVSEEHGFLTGPRVDELSVGQRIRLTPAHVCPVINLTDRLVVVRGETVVARWRVAGRGKVN